MQEIFNYRTFLKSVFITVVVLFSAVNLYAHELTLSWNAPTTNSDGTALTDLEGFNLYQGESPGTYTTSTYVGNSTSYRIDNLEAGTTYYFAITAVDAAGNESDYSNEVSKTIYLPEPDIAITDSVAPADDLLVPFGETTEFNSSDQIVTIRNDGSGDLIIDDIVQLNEASTPFSIISDDCSVGIINPSSSCTLGIKFSPETAGSFTDTVTVICNDTNEQMLTISLSGTGLSSETNNPPTEPELVYPDNNGKGIGNGKKVGFKWKKSRDPDGDVVTYDLNVCQDPDMTIGCETQSLTAAVGSKNIYYADMGSMSYMLLLFGFVLVISCTRKGRKYISLSLVTLSVTAMLFLASCGGTGVSELADGIGLPDSGTQPDEVSETLTNLASNTTYYWQVVATDGKGGETRSTVWQFETQ